MKLVPIRPPGPNTRKARAFAAEIGQLRGQGYTFEAIREALAAAGLQVSNSTVQREVARTAQPQVLVAPATVGSPHDRPTPPTPSAAPAAFKPSATAPGTAAAADRRSGKEIAEAFVSSRINNPLLRAKEPR